MIGVYIIRNINNGKAYVGSSIDIERRLSTHLRQLRNGTHYNIKLQRAFLKAGEAAFTFMHLEEAASDDLVKREQHHMDTLRPAYNILPLAYRTAGQKHSQYTRRRLSASKQGFLNPMFGKHHSAEARTKIAARSNELKDTPAAKAALALGHGWNKGRPWSELARLRMRAAKNPRAIVRIDPVNGETTTYPSAASTRRDGFHSGHVMECVNGVSERHRGFQWRYAAEGKVA